MPTLFLADYIV